MAAQTGRTVSKWVAFKIDDSGGTLRSIAVDSINGVGLTYDESEVTAFFDAVKNVLPNHPDVQITITGPFDNTASTGSHTVLSGVNGGNTPLSMDIQIGMRQAWEAGEPQFGITSSSTSGMLVTNYTVDMTTMKYTANIRVMGPTAPAWGTAAES